MSKKTVVFDFDGVIHKYSKGWQDGSIYDKPVDGIYEVLGKLKSTGWEIVVVSSRCANSDGLIAVQRWLDVNGFSGLVDRVCTEKPPAKVYVDDRAICFDGNHIDSLVYQIENFKTWQQKDSVQYKEGSDSSDIFWKTLWGN